MDPSGRYVLLDAGPGTTSVFGQVTMRHLGLADLRDGDGIDVEIVGRFARTARRLYAALYSGCRPWEPAAVTVRRRPIRPCVLRRAAALAATLTAAGVLAAGCGTIAAGHHPAGAASAVSSGGWRVIRGAPVRSVIVVSPGETFAPPPAWAKPRLDGEQAYRRSLGRGKNAPRRIPPDVSYQLGLLTVPPSVTDVLAWGFSFPPGRCPATSRSVRPPRGRCVEWTFINADNASNPAGTWQRLDTPSPSPSPTPSAVIALRSGGFVSSDLERYSPQILVVQGPLSTIRWSFSAATCSIDLYWFAPPQLQRGPARPACPWRHRFSLSVVGGFASRGHVFTVIGGYVADRMHELVRAVLADGRTWIYDATDADGAWLFAVQRCGNFAGTALRAVEEISQDGTVIARLPVSTAPHLPGPASCST
jgi:hypothetical protein